MDPITLFAMANAAVAAVKKGCQLYKDIRGAAGDVKAVLKDLDEQFHANHPPDKPATVTQRNAYIEEKNRVIELNKKQGETDDIYAEIGNFLGDYFDNMNKCLTVLEEEEKHSQTEIYTGDASLAKRALQRVLMKKKLEAMTVEIREMMIYNAPTELGGLYTDVAEMMEKMGKEQKVLIARQIEKQMIDERRRKARNKKLTEEAWLGVLLLVIVFAVWTGMAVVVNDRIEKYPQYGDGWIPKTERERKYDESPKTYIGR